MTKKIIVRMAAGLGNQMFMYANALALSKTYKMDLLIDNESGFFQKKNQSLRRFYFLHIFSISGKICSNNQKHNNHLKHIKRKILIFFNNLFNKFYIEKKNKKKITSFNQIKINNNKDIYIEGYFQSEKYFSNFKKDLFNEFSVKKEHITENAFIKNELSNSNSVSIHVRRGRYSDEKNFYSGLPNIKNDFFLEKSLKYIFRGIEFFKKKIKNPKFFLWSNNFDGLDTYFGDQFYFLKKFDEINHFNLFKYSKHFIVSPSTFHWWGAWLNPNPDKICTYPKDINPTNNIDFWPSNWIKI